MNETRNVLTGPIGHRPAQTSQSTSHTPLTELAEIERLVAQCDHLHATRHFANPASNLAPDLDLSQAAENSPVETIAQPLNSQAVGLQSEFDVTSRLRIRPANYFRVKPLVDWLLAAILLAAAAPVMLLTALAILWADGRPIFFRQTRVGKHGRTFRIWKFRTMRANAESQCGAVWSHATDPRVTALGSWLRCSHLDELPQLFNVVLGEMNLIGPRPERPEFVRELVSELPFYEQRLAARPGITGLAQLRLDYDRSLAQVHDKVLLDLEYINSTNILKDAALLAGTLPHVVCKLRRKWRSTDGDYRPADGPDDAETVKSVGISPANLTRSSRPVQVAAMHSHFTEVFPRPSADTRTVL